MLRLITDRDRAPAFRILLVCTGNICRSPLAAHLLSHALENHPVEVSSAGTGAIDGQLMTAQAHSLALVDCMCETVGHTSRTLTKPDVFDADLVLALAREHRRAVVELLPNAGRKVFTLREFARLAAVVGSDPLDYDTTSSPIARMQEAVELVAQRRGTLPPLVDPADADVVDPYRRGDLVYRRALHQIAPAVKTTAALLSAAASER
ncbi:MAG: hypothetical protein R2722_11650 [Tessaracoccus sp.]